MQIRFRLPARALILLACLTPWVRAQHWYHYSAPPQSFDWQLFAPIQADLLAEEHLDTKEGYFFKSGRGKFWVSRPERAAIGIANAPPVQAFSPTAVNYLWTDINTTTLPNGLNAPLAGTAASLSLRFPLLGSGSFINQITAIDDSYARTADGWGNQYEFGWVDGYHGWMVSVYQGLDMHRTDRYGFDDKRIDQLGAAQGLNGIDGIPNLDGNGPQVPVNPVAPVAGLQALLAIDGLLEVPVFFDDPNNLLLGFATDVLQNPIDINGDGMIDQNDLVRIAVVFDDMEVNNQTNVNSVEVSAIRRKKAIPGGGSAELFFGAHYLEFDDRFGVNARGGTLADTIWRNHALNRIVGPQLGFRLAKSTQRWTSTLQARFTGGANFLSVRQDGVVGSHLVYGAPGVPNALGANSFFHRVSKEYFSPVGQLEYQTSFRVTNAFAINVGWMGTVAGGVTRASNTVAYRLPNLGILNRQQSIFTHGVTAAVEFNR